MFGSRNRAVAAVLAGVVLLAPLAACGGKDEKASSESPSASPSAFLTRLTDAMAKKKTAKVSLDLGSSLSATADVKYDDQDTAMSIKLDTGAQAVNVVLSGGVMYLQQTKGSKYLKIDKSDPALGTLAGQLAGFGPKSAVESLKGAVTKVVDQGSETVDGQQLEHYVLTVDTKKATSIFGVPQGSAKTPATVKYGLWTDADDLLRQAELTVSGQTLLMKLSEWGKPVTITVPPASQVMTR